MLNECGCAPYTAGSQGISQPQQNSSVEDNGQQTLKNIKIIRMDREQSHQSFAAAYAPLDSDLTTDKLDTQFSHPLASVTRTIFNFLGIRPENVPSALEKIDLQEYFSSVDQAFYGKVAEC